MIIFIISQINNGQAIWPIFIISRSVALQLLNPDKKLTESMSWVTGSTSESTVEPQGKIKKEKKKMLRA